MAAKVGIYKITCLPTNKVYVGCSQNIIKRKAWHFSALRLQKHHNQYLQHAFNKYGNSNFKFEIIELCKVSEFVEKEQFWMNFYNSLTPNGFNLLDSRCCARGKGRFSEETLEKMRKSAIQRAASPEEREIRSKRAKKQHSRGKLGQITWTRKAKYNEKSAIAGTAALKKHISSCSSEEMSRRAKLRNKITEQ